MAGRRDETTVYGDASGCHIVHYKFKLRDGSIQIVLTNVRCAHGDFRCDASPRW